MAARTAKDVEAARTQANGSDLPPLRAGHDAGTWRLVRQDGYGNQFKVADFASKQAAESRCRELEARGHKQAYWVESK